MQVDAPPLTGSFARLTSASARFIQIRVPSSNVRKKPAGLGWRLKYGNAAPDRFLALPDNRLPSKTHRLS
jgi:hypothetical protein